MAKTESSIRESIGASNMDLISIIIPVYNAEVYLERCLNSILNQDYPNIEIVLVNDGSTDGSLAICEKYIREYPHRFRLLNQHNKGASIARKNGIEISKGEYLIFVDSDDYVSPLYVSTLYNALICTATNIAVCKMKRLNNGETCAFESPVSGCIITQRQLFKRFFKYEFWGYGASCYKRSVFKNIIFPEATVNEDYYVKAQMFAKEERVAYVDTSLYFYEQHHGSLSKQSLSLRALGEFDNALATWEYVKVAAPQYSAHALAIVSEVACKWLGAFNTNKSYIEDAGIALYKKKIKQFISKNLIKILLNKEFLWKIKIVVLYNYIKINFKQL